MSLFDEIEFQVFGNKKDDEKQEEGSSRYDSDDTASRRERKEKMVHKELEDLLLKCDEKKICKSRHILYSFISPSKYNTMILKSAALR